MIRPFASRLGSVRAYFGEEALCFFEPGDPADLARAIVSLMTDERRRRELVENSQRLYARYRWEAQKETYLAVSRQLVKAGRAVSSPHAE